MRTERPFWWISGRPRCPHCRKINPAYEQIAEQYAGVLEVVKVDMDGDDSLWNELQVELIPTLRLYVDGKPVAFTVAPESKTANDQFLSGILPEQKKDGAKTKNAEVHSVDLKTNPKKVETSEGSFYGKTIVLATGANPRELGVSNEKELVGRGVAYCAACDGMFYEGKTVVIVGGGNTAAADALLLSCIAEKVIIVHRRDALRATKK